MSIHFQNKEKGLEGNAKKKFMISKRKKLKSKEGQNICPPPLQSRKNLDGKKRKFVHLLQMKMKFGKIK